jgi:SnoaL-like domain
MTLTPDLGPASLADLDARLRTLRDTHDVVDALHRFAAGQDREDAPLFLSAFTDDATLDFTGPARRFGLEAPVMGHDAIAGIPAMLAPLTTTHTVTNPRVTLDGDRATVSALVAAQHVVTATPGRHLLLTNHYDADLVRVAPPGSPAAWRMTHLLIRVAWHDGDPTVLFGPDAAFVPPDDH